MDPSQLLKGVLDMAVLAVIRRGDAYGYEIVRRLRGAGFEAIGDASVYGTLRRLYSAGALTSYVVPSDDGPHRKYYGLNGHGAALLARQEQSWAVFSTSVTELVGSPLAGLAVGEGKK